MSPVFRAVGYGEYIEDPRVNEPDALEGLAEIKAQEAHPSSSPTIPTIFNLSTSIEDVGKA
ncbi:hypothetical protein CCMA1212_010363 [Trichoderma ghanense]|uniref:Uncharacterized protein n=1 Tax=Trichoderma ghanense TaxID=65468 RepID=A0ABY2GPJ1_9HYPO